MLSNKKDQFTSTELKFIQVNKVKLTILFETAISKKASQDNKTVQNMKNTATNELPSRPIKRPKIEIKKNEISGKKIISKYILI